MDEPPPGFALKGIEAVVAAAAGTSTGGASMVADAPHVRTPLLDRRRLGGEEEGGNGGGEEGGYKWQHSASMDEGDEVGGGGHLHLLRLGASSWACLGAPRQCVGLCPPLFHRAQVEEEGE